ncbi:MAG: methyl-accepting chemotaxis protein [Ignavibacteriales bacterium]
MKWYFNMKIGSKLLMGFITVAIISAIVGMIGITNLKTIEKADKLLYEKNAIALEVIGGISAKSQEMRGTLKDMMLNANNKAKIENSKQKLNQIISDINNLLKDYEPTIEDEEDKRAIEDFKKGYNDYLGLKDRLLGFLASNNVDAAVSLAYGEGATIAGEMNKDIATITQSNVDFAKNRSEQNAKTAKDAEVLMIVIIIISIGVAVFLGAFISRLISRPVKEMVDVANRLAKGDISVELKAINEDEIGDLTKAFTKMIDNTKEQAKAADKISAGDLNVTIDVKSENDVLSISMNRIVHNLNSLVLGASELTKQCLDGKLDVRADEDKFSGGYKDIVKGINATLDAVIGPLNVAAEYVDRISKGDIPPKITDSYKGDFNEIKNNLNICIEAINSMIIDTNMLSNAAIEGKLDVRADVNKHQGDFRRILEGVNGTLDSVIGPLNVAAEYVDRISKGDIPPKITDIYKGDFNEIKNNINALIGYLNAFVEDMDNTYKAQKAGDIDKNMTAQDFAGVFNKMALGFNDTINLHVENILKILGIMSAYAEGDFSKDLEALPGKQAVANEVVSKLKNNLINVIKDIEMLVNAGTEGKLDVRADISKHGGDYSKIIAGINATLDAVIGPLNVAAEYVDRISKGDIPPKITDAYKGDFNEIKNNVNGLIEYLSMFVSEMDKFHEEHEEGHTLYVMPVESFAGVYAQMAKNVNRIADIYIQLIRKEYVILEAYSKGDLSKEIETLPGRQMLLKEYLDKLRSSLILMGSEISSLIDAGTNGKLDVRGDATKLEGDFRRAIEGVNAILDAIVAPIQEAAGVMELMSEGILTGSMKGNYKGDFALLKDNLNNSLETLGGYAGEICNTLGEMAHKNLAITLKQDYKGDFIQMRDAVLVTIRSFNEFIGDINSAADQVASGSKQVSISSQELSHGSTQQASSVEEITAAMTQIAAQTKQNALSANEANELSIKVHDEAQRGNGQMHEMLKAMDDINQSSANISKIIKVIDEIAFQTNILALNAAVEAARAGQHGKGFAVVAEEVRNLATRSANATKETAALIEGSIEKVEAGTKIANETAKALDNIVSGVSKTAGLVGDIASASNEQATGIAQINTGINQVSNVTQSITATAEESAAASEELSAQAQMLKDKVSEFRLNTDKSSLGKIDDMNPELFKMVHDMIEKEESTKQMSKASKDKAKLAAKNSKIKISLDDTDFGKY